MVTEASAPPNVRAAAFGKVVVLAAVVVAIDQLTKHLIRTGIEPGDTHKFFLGIQLVHVRNTGVAFSLFSGGGTIVLVFTLVALAVLLVYFTLRPSRPWLWLPTGLLVGGALGNLIDRIAHGAVTDFVKLPLWPAFNVADMAITFGVITLLLVLEGQRGDGR
jgi:signal peptidase II